MKKIFSLVAILISIFTISVNAEVELPTKTEHEKVKIYLFYSTGCYHCHDFLTYFQDNYDEKYEDYFEIKGLEVSNAANVKVLNEVKEQLGIDEDGVPVIIIGDFKQLGFGTDGENLIEEALEQYQNESYEDVVAEAIDKVDDSNVNLETLDECLATAGLVKVADENSLPDGVFVAIIFIILFGGLGGLVYLARK